METTVTFSVSIVGNRSGNRYTGEFTVKTVLSRRDSFTADQWRRQILGPSPENTPPAPALQAEAFMIGQLKARIMDSPEWWKNSGEGLDYEDDNVTATVFEIALQKEEEYKAKLQQQSEAARAELKTAEKKKK